MGRRLPAEDGRSRRGAVTQGDLARLVSIEHVAHSVLLRLRLRVGARGSGFGVRGSGFGVQGWGWG
jgi:hypothetical protein